MLSVLEYAGCPESSVISLPFPYTNLIGFLQQNPHEVYPLFSDFGETVDTRIYELVKLVIARTRKFGNDSSFVSCLEPMPGVRWDRVLVSRVQFDLVKDRVVLFAAFRYICLNSLARFAFYIEPDFAPPAAKRLLLAWIRFAQRWMAMLGAGLTGYHDKLFRTVTIIVDIDDQLQTSALQFAQAEVTTSICICSCGVNTIPVCANVCVTCSCICRT